MKLQLRAETVIHNDILLGSEKCTWNTDGILMTRKRKDTKKSLTIILYWQQIPYKVLWPRNFVAT
jgi:hypothetical protein